VTDQEIIRLYWDRDEQALSQTEKKYGGYCRSIAWNILKNKQDAEECVNDTWLRAWNAMPPQKPAILSVFLGTITRNLSLDRWRQNKAARRGGDSVTLALDELKDCLGDSSAVEEELEIKETAKYISDFLRAQNELNRYLFIRRYWYLDDFTAIAKAAKLTPQQVRARLYRMRGQLKKALQKEGIFV